jgi:hypothetical protein
VYCHEVILPELAIGNAAAKNVLGIFRPFDGDPTTVGCGFLCDYRAIFDFPNRTLVLIPRAKPRVREDDMSGIHIEFRAGDFVIGSIDRGSSASRAGLRGGETVEEVDGVAATELSASQIRERLKSGDGNVVQLRVKDGGDVERTVDITLQRKVQRAGSLSPTTKNARCVGQPSGRGFRLCRRWRLARQFERHQRRRLAFGRRT